ncbi:TetR/AcrR family transcriptional regulator [Arenibaculum pallidiluteum]|uniref:TetR/AcrR family transcriptional regulator n=1 Tax=Arenibaculum pallidiluteum TaxID=2812559 RepID=UPI001A970766|nr:TetR/AcrR family transcriptional regulator [Arenibaculum pallidiluteum]
MTARRPRQLNPRKIPRQARSEATVRAIFEATIQVLLQLGFARLTTTRVAERAGVSVGTMYQYFPNKEALLHAVVSHYLDRVAAAVEESCARTMGKPLGTASDALVSAYVMAKCGDIAASQALYRASSELEVSEPVTAAFGRLNRAAARLLGSAPDAAFEDIEDVAFSLVAALTGATRVAIENNADRRGLDAFHRKMLEMSRAFLHSASMARSRQSAVRDERPVP